MPTCVRELKANYMCFWVKHSCGHIPHYLPSPQSGAVTDLRGVMTTVSQRLSDTGGLCALGAPRAQTGCFCCQCSVGDLLLYFKTRFYSWIQASLVAQTVKHLSAVWETKFRSLGWEDPLEKEVATHSSPLAWKIPWTEEPNRLQPVGSQRVRHDWVTSLFFFLIFCSWRGLTSVLCSLIITFESVWEVCAKRPLNIWISKTLMHGLKKPSVKQHSLPGGQKCKGMWREANLHRILHLWFLLCCCLVD